MKKDLFIITGGIGKHICFSSCLNKFEKVNIMSAWPEIFKNHPNVNFSYNYNLSPIKDDTVFLNKFNNIYNVEAYDSYFFRNKIHLVKNYRKILKQDLEEDIYNEIYFTEKEEQDLKSLLSQLDNFVLVQFMGSDEGQTETDFEGSRGLIKSEAQEIINILNFDLKLNVVNVHSSVDLFSNTAKIDLTLNFMNYAHLLKYAKGFIGIDSSLNHMSANKFCSTKGVVLWNDINVKERFCYDKNINLITNTPNIMRFNPKEIIDSFEKTLND